MCGCASICAPGDREVLTYDRDCLMGFKDLCRDIPKYLEPLGLLRNDGPPMMGGGGFNRDSRDYNRGGNKVRRCGYNINRYDLIITGLFFSPIEEDLKLRGSLTSHYC